ncbi:hypothetical protein CIB84_001619 [Bambusicola thoracicus]|uniref:Fibronectin type-III domain-containing protein n=1 Tax=Bambusicola thoracicus TaxID=9083 RepID=A0A2P4TE30_BAMTH|nr:hypothetical protein CIB84_001619 [Bambusicola thoracicus]
MFVVDLSPTVSGIVPKPRNARINSVNFRSVLLWDPPGFHRGNLSYTVQAKSIFPKQNFNNVTTNLNVTECDVSSLSVYGAYVLRFVKTITVKETLRCFTGRSPQITDVATVQLRRRTVIGPPSVNVKSESGTLHVDFKGPAADHEHDKWSLKQYYGSWIYRILYWKKGSNKKVIHIDTKHSSEILSQLEPWTIYCIQVQGVIPEWNKTGELSQELCERTTHNGVTPVWIVVTVLLGSMLAVIISVPVCFFSFWYLYRVTKHVFCPSDIFPQHLKEFLSKPPSGSQFFSPVPHEEHHFHDWLTVISEEPKSQRDETVEEASETTERHQDSKQEVSDSEILPPLERD